MMNQELLKLKPERLWHYFTEILAIPRPSKKEEQIIKYLMEFGNAHGLETIQDETGNVLIRKHAFHGMENRKPVVLQSHIDMVCEKNSDTVFDFEKDPIQAWIDGEWVKSKGTTLGADDGIGIAAQLAILEADNIEHGPIECLFTVDEETGLTGAFGLKPGFLRGEILLNLDSEDEGELFIGCAGGKDTVITFEHLKEPFPQNNISFRIKISGLTGGHSGDDIHKGRANANKLLNRFLWQAQSRFELNVAGFDGGNLRNAIAREATALVCILPQKEQELIDLVTDFEQTARQEYRITEPALTISIQRVGNPDKILHKTTQFNLLNSLYACPHGVIAWSAEIPNFVETSTNLASVKMNDNDIVVTTSQRSSVESAKQDICNMVSSVFQLAGAKVEHSDGYPGWQPNSNSEIVDLTRHLYKELFDEQPKVLAIHAGLECGLIGNVYPAMDMISYGPTIKGAHSPDERLNIETVDKFWKLTIEILKNIPPRQD
jgi:dipeptidase D